ncbi:hypothetical protein [Paenibacillus sp. FSL M7-1046]|uniref:hypothetical protein n=1 Tax=Paenibacillus sp. FSL M7-1046 TaxID=2975315 RepID=UPI002691C941
MIALLVEIDGYFHRSYISGAKCTKQELKQKYLKVKEQVTDLSDLPEVFYKLYNFEQLPLKGEVEVDFVIDTDTDRIYKPSY